MECDGCGGKSHQSRCRSSRHERALFHRTRDKPNFWQQRNRNDLPGCQSCNLWRSLDWNELVNHGAIFIMGYGKQCNRKNCQYSLRPDDWKPAIWLWKRSIWIQQILEWNDACNGSGSHSEQHDSSVDGIRRHSFDKCSACLLRD